MPSISNLLSPDNLNNIISYQVKRGSVFRMHLDEEEGVKGKNHGENGRNKYFVVLGVANDGSVIGFVLINSHVNANLPDELKDLHYPINVSSYPFLKRNSFVNCSIIKEINRSKFSLLFSPNSKKGEIKEEDMDMIIGAVKSSPSIPPKLLKKFGIQPE